jgi:hypothetical protein
MTEAHHLADALEHLFTDPASGAFVPFAIATDGLAAAQAATAPAPGFNSVWAVVNHVRYWEEMVVRHMRGLPVSPDLLGAPDPSGWPPVGEPTDEAAWQAARAQALSVNSELAALVAPLNDQEVGQTFAPWGVPLHRAIQSLIAHNSYHTCEVISIRHMQGLSLERT